MLKVFKDWIDRYFADEQAVLLVVLLVAGLSVVIIFGGTLAPVFASLIFAYVLQGLVAKFEKKGISHVVSVLIAFTVFVGIFLAILLIVLPMVWHQMTAFLNESPLMLKKALDWLKLLPQQYPELISPELVQEWLDTAAAKTAEVGPLALSFVSSSIPGIMALIIYLVLVPILVFFFLKDKKLLINSIVSLLPTERTLLNQIGDEMNDQIANYIRGKVVEIVIVGIVTYLGFVAFGLNYSALLALLVGLSVVIPYIGAAVVTVPVALIGLFQWGTGSEFIWMMVVYGVIQALDGNVLVPLLFSEAVNLHPVAIIVAVLFFGGLWGFWGVFFAIPLATLVKAVFNAWPRDESGVGDPESN